MTGITPDLSIITLNVNGLNSLIKIHRIVDWIKKQHPTPIDRKKYNCQRQMQG
jgi:hypothetical protein